MTPRLFTHCMNMDSLLILPSFRPFVRNRKTSVYLMGQTSVHAQFCRVPDIDYNTLDIN